MANYNTSNIYIYILTLTLFGLSLLSFFDLTSPYSRAEDSVVSDVAIMIPISCSFSDDTTPGTHSATINPGTYEDEIGYTNFTVFCNDSAGFSLYAIGYSNEEYGNTTLIGANTGQTIVTGIAQSGNTSNWAMRMIKVTDGSYQPNNLTILSAPNVSGGADASFANYHTVPSEYTKVATYTSSTDTTLGSKLQSTYAAFISSSQMADTYTGKVKYTLVHPANESAPTRVACATNKICYNPNTSFYEGSMGQQSASADTDAMLLASNYSRTGYGFAGWNTEPDYSGSFYGPNETVTTPTDMSTGLPLYAVWVASSGIIQDWTGCPNLTKADEATDIFAQSVTALTDLRDNQTYAVAKLADGNCWMIENLRLEADNSTDASLALGFGGVFVGLANSEPGSNFGSEIVSNSRYVSDGSGTMYNQNTGTLSDIGTNNDPSARFPRYNNYNTHNLGSTVTSASEWTYGYGNYYSYAAAIASTSPKSSPSSSVTTSICFSGWRLPIGGKTTSDKSFAKLSIALGGPSDGNTATGDDGARMSRVLRSFPNNYTYNGNIAYGGDFDRGAYGRYWSSTPSSSIYGYQVIIYNSTSYFGTGGSVKQRGSGIRCILE